MKRGLKLLVAIMVIFCVSVPAESSSWKIDTVHTGFYFDIQHIFSTVRGSFDEFSGNIKFNPDDIAGSSFQITVKTGSVNTNNRKRDTHLRSDEFFSSDKYPEMTFTSTSIKHISRNKYEVTGNLKIKDVSKQVTVPFIYKGSKENPLNKKEIVGGLDFQFSIDRLEYNVGGVKFFDMGIIDKNVNITVSFELLKTE